LTVILGVAWGQNEVIKTSVREVVVPVVVTDKAGHYATNLERGDFTVLEDGVVQKIVAFRRSVIDSGPQAAASPEGPLGTGQAAAPAGQNATPRETYLICLDMLHSGLSGFTRIRASLKKFFAEEQAGDSQYALFALGRELHPVLDSTRDPAQVLAALDQKKLWRYLQDSEAANLAADTDRFVQMVGAWCGQCQCSNPKIDLGSMGCPTLKGQVTAAVLSFSERAASLNLSFLEHLTQLVTATASMPTKRTILFVSDGFNRFPGQEFYNILRVYSVGDLNLKFNPRDLQPQLNAILKLAVDYDIRFYTIDSRGLYGAATVPGSGWDASSHGSSEAVSSAAMTTAWFNGDAMAQLATQTGGQFFENSNDLLKGVRTAFADGREEYVLAYVSGNPKVDAQFRRISVEVKDKKLRVAAKAGYWASP
jgi:VWFA-related protein